MACPTKKKDRERNLDLMLVQEKQKLMPRSLLSGSITREQAQHSFTSKKRVWASVRTDPAQIHTAGIIFPKLDPFC